MLLNVGLKKFAEGRLSVQPGSADDVYKSAIAKALADGVMTAGDFAALSQDSVDPRKQISEIVGAAVSEAVAGLQKQIDAKLAAAPSADEFAQKIQSAIKAAQADMGNAAGGQKTPQTPQTKETKGSVDGGTNIDPSKAFGGDSVKVVPAIDRYDRTRKGAYYSMAKHGRETPVMLGGVALNHPSDADRAVVGAFGKFWLRKNGGGNYLPPLTDHEEELLKYAAHEMRWVGEFNGQFVNREKLSPYAIKSIIDDATSGGAELVPEVFDDAVVLTPILTGELFPLVNLVPISRGSAVDGAAISNPTWNWDEGDTDSATLETTTGFVSAFDTAIFPAAAGITIGLNFLSDTPVDLGAILIERFGATAAAELDRVIAVGNGTSEPQGVFEAAGTTVVPSSSGTSGPYTVLDAERLQFGVDKAHRSSKGGRNVYIGNEKTYRRFRQIKVGTSDERRVFGMTHGDYMLLNFPFKIQADVPDTHVAFANLGHYRMYRRAGMSVKVETGGNELVRKNLMLIVCRMRYGGKLELGGAAAKMTDGQLASAG